MENDKICYTVINLELNIDFSEESSDYKNNEKEFISTLLIHDLPNYLEKFNIDSYVKINKFSKGSLIVDFSIILVGFQVISGVKDAYDVMNLIKNYIRDNYYHRHIRRISISNGNVYIEYRQKKKFSPSIERDQITFLLQLLTIALIIFLIGIEIGRRF